MKVKWHHSATLAGNPNGRTHYDIGADDCSNVAIVYPSEDGDADTLRKARLIALAPATAAERDRLRALNAELLVALKNILGVMMGGWPERVAVAQAVIRKAEGEETKC